MWLFCSPVVPIRTASTSLAPQHFTLRPASDRWNLHVHWLRRVLIPRRLIVLGDFP